MHLCMATNSTCYRQPLAASPGEPRPIASEVAHCVRVAEDVSQTGQMVIPEGVSQTQCVRVRVCVRVCVCVCVCVKQWFGQWTRYFVR